jgi:hypothetical protein
VDRYHGGGRFFRLAINRHRGATLQVAAADSNVEHYPVSTRLNTAKNDDATSVFSLQT